MKEKVREKFDLFKTIKLFLAIVLATLGTTSCVTTQTQSLSSQKSKEIAIIKYEMARNIILHKDYKNLAEAFSYLESAKEILKKDPKIYYTLAIAYKLRGNLEKYEFYLKKTIKLDPNFFDAYNALGVYYSNIKEYKKAIKIFSQLINNPLYPDTDIAFYNRALAFVSLGKIKNAEDDLRNAAIFSNYSIPLYLKTLINLEIRNKQCFKALEDINIMETHAGKSCFTTIKKAYCFYKIGNKQEALNILKNLTNPTCNLQKENLLKELSNDNNTNN